MSAGHSCKRRPCDQPVIPGAQPALESVRSLTEQEKQRHFLTFVDLPAQAIEQPGLVDQEADAGDRSRPRLDDNIGKPCQPGVDVVALASELKRGIVGFAVAIDRFRECRSEERRVGKECVSTCRSRWSAYP